uniref:Uncharacterized protein n=1 Tax=Arundo donax TaxID=35708 RepID=A0A0A8XWS2_ARUDO
MQAQSGPKLRVDSRVHFGLLSLQGRPFLLQVRQFYGV